MIEAPGCQTALQTQKPCCCSSCMRDARYKERLCMREALRDPAQNMRIKRARRAPSSFRRDIFQAPGKSVRGKACSDSPMTTTMSHWLGTKEKKARPAHPRTLRGKTSTFAGHLATFHARSKGSDGHARIFTCRAAVDVESRFAFPG